MRRQVAKVFIGFSMRKSNQEFIEPLIKFLERFLIFSFSIIFFFDFVLHTSLSHSFWLLTRRVSLFPVLLSFCFQAVKFFPNTCQIPFLCSLVSRNGLCVFVCLARTVQMFSPCLQAISFCFRLFPIVAPLFPMSNPFSLTCK